jgi:hypothetical protein
MSTERFIGWTQRAVSFDVSKDVAQTRGFSNPYGKGRASGEKTGS